MSDERYTLTRDQLYALAGYSSDCDDDAIRFWTDAWLAERGIEPAPDPLVEAAEQAARVDVALIEQTVRRLGSAWAKDEAWTRAQQAWLHYQPSQGAFIAAYLAEVERLLAAQPQEETP